MDPQARCLMKNGALFEFELLLPSGSETDLKLARYIQLCLNDVGIRVHLKAVPLEDLSHRQLMNTDFDAVQTELTPSPRNLEVVLNLWGLGNAVSYSRVFYSPETAALAGRILDARDLEQRKALSHEFDRLIADLQPGSFLFQKRYIDAMSKRFTLKYPFSFSHYGFYWLQYARLKNE
ncbi:MAG: hypothetical protein AB1724_07115 [Thermodesulfobacteriota bacterium]